MLEQNGDNHRRPLFDIKYPEIPRNIKQCDIIWDETIYDPYRDIEIDLDKMVKLQTKIVNTCMPAKEVSVATDVLKNLSYFERQSCPKHHGKCTKLFFYYNDGSMENDVIMMEDLNDESSVSSGEQHSSLAKSPAPQFAIQFDGDNEGNLIEHLDDGIPPTGHDEYKIDDIKQKLSASHLANRALPDHGKCEIIINVNSEKCLIKLFVVSPDCDSIAYVTRSTVGSYNENIYCYMVSRKAVLNEYVKDVHYSSVAWTRDSMGFFYTKNTNQNYDSTPEIYYHWTVFGMEDVLVGKFSEQKFWKFQINVTENGRYLIVTVSSDKRGNFLYFAKIPRDGMIEGLLKFYQVVNKWKRTYKYITSFGSNVVFLTDRFAMKRCLVQFSLNTRVPKCHCDWKKIIPETDELLVDAVAIKKHLYFCHYLNAFGFSFYKIYKANISYFENIITTNLHNLYISEITTNGDGLVYYRCESFDTPSLITRLQYREGKTPKLTVLCNNRPKRYPTKGKFVFDSYVGKPDVHLIHTTFEGESQSENQKKGPTFCYLVVNGGFGELNVPKYDPLILYLLIKRRACITRVLLPGGGEFGRSWQNKGRLRNKRETFQIMSKIFLKLKEKYTNIILYGCHNGGLIGTVCSMVFSNYLSGVIAAEGITDLFHISDYGCDALTKEYGNAENCHNDFEAIKSYSPYFIATVKDSFKHSIIPPMLMQCSSKEPIFHYRHTVKLVAQLQYALTKGIVKGNGPIVLCSYDIPEYEPKPLNDLIRRYADRLVFIDNVALGISNAKKNMENLK